MQAASVPLPREAGAAEDRRRFDAVGPVLWAFAVSRLLIVGMALLSGLALVRGPQWKRGGFLGLAGGDANAYLAMARGNQWFDSTLYEPTIAFFPLYPLIVKLVSFVMLGNVAVAGIAVANVALLAAGFLLHHLLLIDGYGARVRNAAVTFLMFSPASYFFSCAVADSTALALAIACLVGARRGRWLLAIALALGLCATINLGFWIIVPLVVEHVLQQRATAGRGSAGVFGVRTLLLALVPLHLALVLLLSQSRGHWVLAPLRLALDWRLAYRKLVEVSTLFVGYRTFYDWLFWAVIAAAVALCVTAVRMRIRSSYLAYAAAMIVGCLWAHDREAARTLGMAFPLFIVLGLLTERFERLSDLALTVSITLLMLCTLVAANGFWLT